MRRQRVLRFDENALEKLWSHFPEVVRTEALKLLAQLIARAGATSSNAIKGTTKEEANEVIHAGFKDHR